MTQPDGLEPTSAANYDSFAGFANTTQAEWEAQMRDGVDTHFTPWSGICLMIESIPFFGDLISAAGGAEGQNFGVIEAVFNGFIDFVESLCSLILGSGEPPEGTTPTTIFGGVFGVFGQITNSPLFTGLLDLAESTGNLVSDILDGFMKFANLLCGIVTGVADPDPEGTTPQTIMSGFNGIFDMLAQSSFISGFIDLATGGGTLVLQLVDGVIQFVNQIWDIFAALIPGDLGSSSPLGLLDMLTTWIAPFLDFVEGIAGGGLDVVAKFFEIFTDVIGIFGDPLGLGTGNPTLGNFEDIPILGPIIRIFNGVLGFLQGGPLSLVGGGSLVDTFLSLLTRPFFNSNDAVAGGGIWSVDSTTTFNGQGSVTAIADGSTKELQGNSVGVSQGQRITASVNAQWAGLTGSGSPIRLKIVTNLGEVVLASKPYSSSGSFASNLLTGSYTVAANVTTAAMMMVIEASATGGQVWFSNPTSNMLPVPAVVEEVVGISGIFDQFFDIFGGLTGSSGKGLGDVLGIGRDFFDALADVGGADFFDLQERMSEIRQTMQIFANILITPINSFVTSIRDWFSVDGGIKRALEGLSTSVISSAVDAIEERTIEVRQTLQTLAGSIITPITSLVQDIVNWFNAL